MSSPARVPAGVPTGGQFATSVRAESGLTLRGTDLPEVASGVTDGVERREVVCADGRHERVALIEGNHAGSVLFSVHAEGDGWAVYENAVEVIWMQTRPEYQGRGVNRALLRSLLAEHDGKTFITERFERPTAKRSWRAVIGDADGTEDDGEFGCSWCCESLGADDDGEEASGLCGRCECAREQHRSGVHRPEPSGTCWDCDAERLRYRSR